MTVRMDKGRVGGYRSDEVGLWWLCVTSAEVVAGLDRALDRAYCGYPRFV